MCVEGHTPRDQGGGLIRAEYLRGAPVPVKAPPYPNLKWAIKAPAIAGLPGYNIRSRRASIDGRHHGQRPGLQAPERHEQRTAGEDIAIFPLAISLLSGPGTITTVLLLTNQVRGDFLRMGIFAAVIAGVYLIAWWVLYAGERLMARLGESKVHIITRVLGIILAALAVQYVLSGIAGYYELLVTTGVR